MEISRVQNNIIIFVCTCEKEIIIIWYKMSASLDKKFSNNFHAINLQLFQSSYYKGPLALKNILLS